MVPNLFKSSKSAILKMNSINVNFSRSVAKLKLIKDRAYVNGEWVCAVKEGTFTVTNPANGQTVSTVPDMSVKDVEKAVRAANTAFNEWKNTTANERSKLMRKWYDLMMENQEALAQIITLESGKPFLESMAEVNYGNSYIEHYAEEAKRIRGEILQSEYKNKKYFVEKQPIGVVGLITAFNFPLAMITRKLSAALAAGCTAVIKPATDTPLTSLAMAEIAHVAGIPNGVINIITSSHASNPPVVNHLCTNPTISGISFTGSVQVGKIINEKCAQQIKRVSLELGGNAPFIVYNSANVENAVQSALRAKFRMSGQTCVAPNRFLVQDEIYDCFLENLTEEMRKLKMGDGSMADVNIGPMINRSQLEKVSSLVDDAVTKGANIILGGQKAPKTGDLFYEPTILSDVRETMILYHEEIFGPVVNICKFRTEEESLFIANSPDVGLAGYIFSQDIAQIFRVSKLLEVGMVGVNEGIISSCEVPFGGVKQSGIGREGSHQGIEDYINYKYICLGNLKL